MAVKLKKRATLFILIPLLAFTTTPVQTIFVGQHSLPVFDYSDAFVQAPRSNERHISISFPAPQVAKTGNHDWLKMANCSYFIKPGQPMLPVKSLVVKLPERSVVTNVRAKVREASLLGSFSILPVPMPAIVGSQIPGEIKENPAIYEANSLFPKEWYVYREANGIDAKTNTRARARETVEKYVQHNIENYTYASVHNVKTFMEFALLGDPTLRIYNPDYPETLNVPEDYPTIQTAINTAYDGDTILVSPGTYYENVVVNKSVSLIGEDPGSTIVDGSGSGDVITVWANNTVIENFTIRNGGAGISMIADYGEDLRNCTIKYNNITNSYGGIYLGESSNNTVSGNTLTNNNYSLTLYWSSNNSISGNNITNNGDGVSLGYSSNNTVSGNNITVNNNYGIELYTSSSNIVSGNNITNNSYCGVFLQYSSNNTVSENNITNQTSGVRLDDSSHNTFSGNNIANNYGYGVVLSSSSNNILRGNRMANNTGFNFGVWGLNSSDFVNDVDATNTVDGKPIYYWVNRRDMAVPSDAGHITLVNCTKITVQNLNLTANNLDGVLLAYTTNSTITKNNIRNSYYGVRLLSSSNNTVSGNDLAVTIAGIPGDPIGIHIYLSSNNTFSRNNITNGYFGIYLSSSSYNTVSENNITNNGDGIHLYASNNSFYGNNIANNSLGIFLYSSPNNSFYGNNIANNYYGVAFSANNIFYFNNFINNTNQVWQANGPNVWDDGYPSGGNYWSDYAGVDDYQGPNQNILGSDGIGDTPYVIDENNQDNYPLVIPFILGDLNRDGFVNIFDLLVVRDALASEPGYPNWNPCADLNGDGYINIFDLLIVRDNLT